MKHTIGEWKATPNFDYVGNGTTGVCEILKQLRNPEEVEANAKLIAAAPDLLEALQIIANDNLSENESREAWITNVKRIAKAAIKKATLQVFDATKA